jgi:D-serine deaminase-like pyridoxal phosphate-dependent protein
MSPLPRIAAIDGWLIDSTVKGYPGTASPTRLGDIAARGWSVLRDDLPLPAAIIKASSLAHNRAWMRRYLDRAGAVLCPHGKTTMSPQLFAAQLADGAFGITCATVSQLQVYRRFGIGRVLMANQLIGARAIAYVLEELARDPSFEIYLLVDSVAGVERLARAARSAGLARPLRVLLEVGIAGERTGVRSMAALEDVLAAIEAAEACVRVHGVEAFEGVVDAGPPVREQVIEGLLSFQLEASARARRSTAAAVPWLLSAGGSSHFDLAAERLRAGAQEPDSLLVLRSGCYLTHDHGAYASAQRARAARSQAVTALGEGFRPALEVWTHVQSRPEPGRAFLTAGKRDVSFDLDLPRPIGWLRPGQHATPQPLDAEHRVVKLNDQHAHLSLPHASPLAVGDLVALGISHPCTTFDKWQLLYLVDDDYTVIDAIRTFF